MSVIDIVCYTVSQPTPLIHCHYKFHTLASLRYSLWETITCLAMWQHFLAGTRHGFAVGAFGRAWVVLAPGLLLMQIWCLRNMNIITALHLFVLDTVLKMMPAKNLDYVWNNIPDCVNINRLWRIYWYFVLPYILFYVVSQGFFGRGFNCCWGKVKLNLIRVHLCFWNYIISDREII